MGVPFYKSKTLIFGVVLGVVSIAGVFGFNEYQPDALTTDTIGVIVAAIVIVLRLLTKEPIVKD